MTSTMVHAETLCVQVSDFPFLGSLALFYFVFFLINWDYYMTKQFLIAMKILLPFKVTDTVDFASNNGGYI